LQDLTPGPVRPRELGQTARDADVRVMTTRAFAPLAFWFAVAGGLGICVAELIGSEMLAVAGAATFAFGVALFFVGAVLRARTQDVTVSRAVALATRDALRFAVYLMP
jgi:hypothetical protein